MQTIKNCVKEKLFITIIVSCFVWSIISHGMVFFNKYSFHDDIGEFNRVGATNSHGRWFLGETEKLVRFVFGTNHYSTPVFNGIFTILCLALMIYMICKQIKISDSWLLVVICGIMVSFPTITGIFGYIYTAPYYYCAAMAGVFGAYIFYRNKSILSLLLCIVLMTCSVGTYQANIPINLCVLLLFMINDMYIHIDFKGLLKLLFCNGIICLGFISGYFIFNELFLKKYNFMLSTYKGINNFGRTSKRGYIKRGIEAYKEFFNPTDAVSRNMFPFNLRYLHIFLIIISVILIVIFLFREKDNLKRFCLAVIFAAFPAAAYFIYVMVGTYEVHGLMTYGEAFTFLLFAWIYERLRNENRLVKGIKYLSYSALVLMSIMFARISNICYLKAEIMQSEAISYFTTLITQIKSVEGYTDETPIVYINDSHKKDKSFQGTTNFEPVYLLPYGDGGQEDQNIYGGEYLINDYLWEGFMHLWCGFSRIPGDRSLYREDERVKKMPHYPDYGSIQKLDDVIVVKF